MSDNVVQLEPELTACCYCGTNRFLKVKQNEEFFWVECLDCNCGGPMVYSKAEAIKKWNGRKCCERRQELSIR